MKSGREICSVIYLFMTTAVLFYYPRYDIWVGVLSNIKVENSRLCYESGIGTFFKEDSGLFPVKG